MSRRIEMAGLRIAGYVVLWLAERRAADGSAFWVCACLVCGHERELHGRSLRRGRAPRCACGGASTRGRPAVNRAVNEPGGVARALEQDR